MTEKRKIYRFDPALGKLDPAAAMNARLLAEANASLLPFVLAGEDVSTGPMITKISTRLGNTIHSEPLWAGTLTCVDRIEHVVRTSDGQLFTVLLNMAVQAPVESADGAENPVHHVFVTPQARPIAEYPGLLWELLGGELDCGDSKDTQQEQFDEELSGFWRGVLGEDESLRMSVVDLLRGVQPAWQSVSITSGGQLTIQHKDGTIKLIRPPSADAQAAISTSTKNQGHRAEVH